LSPSIFLSLPSLQFVGTQALPRRQKAHRQRALHDSIVFFVFDLVDVVGGW